MRTGRARVGDVELAYDVFGTSGRPLVLVMGIATQRIFWDERFCQRFVAAGFHVVRFDHRDVGESTRMSARAPSPVSSLVRRMLNQKIAAPYSLSDLADDVAGLIDALGWRDAHIFGSSLGAMVGQHLAFERPHRVRSLTSALSTPGARRYLPEPRALAALFQRTPRTPEEAGQALERAFSVLGSPVWPPNNERLRRVGAQMFERGSNPDGMLRQFTAVLASGDRTPRLGEVRAPTLVIHGSADPMFSLSAGRAVARLIPNATWLPVAGMAHDMPEPLWPMMVAAIARHAERADRAYSSRSSDTVTVAPSST